MLDIGDKNKKKKQILVQNAVNNYLLGIPNFVQRFLNYQTDV